MASTQLVVLAVLAVVLPTVAMATNYTVGDGAGWTINFDYQGWANGKTFYVGDALVFNYPVGDHNVFKVNQTGFNDCIKPPLGDALTSGNDVIPLAKAGQKWYICGVADHCANRKQKLSITVEDTPAPGPAPTTGPPAAPAPNSAHALPVSSALPMVAMFALALLAV